MRLRGKAATVSTAFGEQRADYAAMNSGRYKSADRDLPPMGASADYHYRSESKWLLMIERARKKDRDDPVINRLIDVATQNTVQTGITLDIDTGDVNFDALLRSEWDPWWESTNCTLARNMTGPELEYLSVRSSFVDGGLYHILVNDEGTIRLQTMEAHRLRKPKNTRRNIKFGIQMNAWGVATAYWFTRKDVDGVSGPVPFADMESRPAYDAEGYPVVLPIVRRNRFSQTIGISALAPILDTAGQFDDIQFAKLVQQQMTSCTIYKRTRSAEWQGNNTPPPTGERTQQPLADGLVRTIDGLAPGLELVLDPGEDVEGINTNVPGTEYFPHARLVLQIISISLGVPLCILLLDGSETNFSGWRGAVDQARMGWRRNQASIIQQLRIPVWVAFCRNLIARRKDIRKDLESGALKPTVNEPRRWVTFNPPGYPYIQPLEDAKAFDLKVKTNQTSMRRAQAEQGNDWDVIKIESVDDRVDIILHAIKRANEVNAKNPGAKVEWRELAGTEVRPMDLVGGEPDGNEKRNDKGGSKP